MGDGWLSWWEMAGQVGSYGSSLGSNSDISHTYKMGDISEGVANTHSSLPKKYTKSIFSWNIKKRPSLGWQDSVSESWHIQSIKYGPLIFKISSTYSSCNIELYFVCQLYIIWGKGQGEHHCSKMPLNPWADIFRWKVSWLSSIISIFFNTYNSVPIQKSCFT